MTQANEIRKLLIVDDSRVTRMMLRALVLAKHPDWVMIEAASGNEALEILNHITPDYCTMDINMPGMLGTDAAAQILARYPGIRVAVFSANIQENQQAQAKELGALFVAKPVTVKSVAKALEFFESGT